MPVKPRALVVDPDPVARQLIVSALAAAEADWLAVGSGQEASELLEREKFDGIFLDWALPDISAAELVAQIRRSKLNYAVPIIAVAAENQRAVMAESFKQGVTFFLGKPLSAGKVRRLLAASHGLILEERRHFQRAKVTLPVECRHEQEESRGASVDLSARGVRLSAKKLYAEDTNLQLRFQLPSEGEPTLQPSAQVVRLTAEKEMGIRFLYLSAKDRKKIADFVEKTLEKQEPGAKKSA